MHVLEQIQKSPTKEEIKEYAQLLGIKEKEYYYIAEKGLTTNLPPNWTAIEKQDGLIYYFNEKTKKSQWDHPNDTVCKEEYQLAIQNKPKSKNNEFEQFLESESSESLQESRKEEKVNLPPLPNRPSSQIIKEVTGIAPIAPIANIAPITSIAPIGNIVSIPRQQQQQQQQVESEIDPKWKNKLKKEKSKPRIISSLSDSDVKESKVDYKSKKSDSIVLNKVSSLEEILDKYDLPSMKSKDQLEDTLKEFIETKIAKERDVLQKEFEVFQYKLELQVEKVLEEKLQHLGTVFMEKKMQLQLEKGLKVIEKNLCASFNKDISDFRQSIQNGRNGSTDATVEVQHQLETSLQLVNADLSELNTEIKLLKNKVNSLATADIEEQLHSIQHEVQLIKQMKDQTLQDSFNDEKMIKINLALNEDNYMPHYPLKIQEEDIYIKKGYKMDDIENRIDKHSMWLNSFLQRYQSQ